jgi:hypothetical protein
MAAIAEDSLKMRLLRGWANERALMRQLTLAADYFSRRL